jgi:predicted nucleotidyltransferase
LVVLFGSLARDDARSDSDADIGVLGGGYWDQLNLGAAIGSLMNRDAHVVDLGVATDLLRYQVARDGVLLFETRLEWARFQAESAVRYFDIQPMMQLCADGIRQRLAREARRSG